MRTRRRTATAANTDHAPARPPLQGLRRACATLCLLTALFAALPAHAQCSAVNKAFSPGEKVDYNLYFNWKFIWIKAGTACLTTDTATYDNRPAYRFDLLANSSKRLDLFFKMRDTLTCYVSDLLEPRYFCKAAEEGKRYTVDEAWFSYANDSSHVKQRRTWRDGRIQEMEYSDTRCIFDMLSILAQARSYDPDDYRPGDKIHFPMATGRKVEQQTLIYRGKEDIDADDDRLYHCLVFSFVEYDKKGKEQEVITFYISDDDNHLPVRLDMYLNIGSAKAFLKHVEGNRHPITSVFTEG